MRMCGGIGSDRLGVTIYTRGGAAHSDGVRDLGC